MSLELLPDELLSKILKYLGDEPIAYISLASTCKRLNNIYKAQVGSKFWLQRRPVAFNIYLKPNEYQGAEIESSCECDHIMIRGISTCYYESLYCLLTAKCRYFSTLNFRDSYLFHNECLRSIDQAQKVSKLLAQNQLSSLVEVTFYNCYFEIQWLDSLMKKLPNITYLDVDSFQGDLATFDATKFHKSQAHKPLRTSRTLTHLGIKNEMHAPVYNYLLDNYPAKELDVSGLNVVAGILRIHERGFAHIDDPSRQRRGLGPLVVLPYLIKNGATVERLIVDEIELVDIFLEITAKDPNLQHLVVIKK